MKISFKNFQIRILVDSYLQFFKTFHRDVHIGLIGYSEMMKWPQHFTLNGDTNIDGEVKNMKFEEGKPIISYQVILQKKNYIFKKFLSKLNLSK